MKRNLLILPVLFSFLSITLLAQTGHEGHSNSYGYGFDFWFGLLELPFLALCIVYAFLTAQALKGGIFGKGMSLMAWGFLVMAIGHLHMQIDHLFGFNIFKTLLGEMVGQLFWVIALIITWGLSGYGFYLLYKAARGN